MRNLTFLCVLGISLALTSCNCDWPFDCPDGGTGSTGSTGSTGTTGVTGATGSSYDEYADWMTILLTEHPNRVICLKDICIPRAHDAGMWRLTTCEFGSNACNTKTQDKSFAYMLEAGIRNFDVRPVVAGGIYFTQHKTDCGGLGCRGDRLENILQETKDFVDQHAELVLLDFGNYCDVDPLGADFQNFVNTMLGDKLYKETESFTTPLNKRDLNSIIPSAAGTGKVLIIYGGVDNNSTNRANGIFSSSYAPVSGSYSNSFDVDYVIADQLNKYANFDQSSDNRFEISWTLTLNAQESISCAIPFSGALGIEGYANIAHARLTGTIDDMINDGFISVGKIPNLIGVDFADYFITDECIKINHVNIQ